MTSIFIQRVRSIIDENGGARLLIGIGALFIIFMAYLLSLAEEKVADKAIEVAALKAEVSGLRALAPVEGLQQRLEAYRQALASYESRVIRAETAGLISAEIQSLMRSGASKAGLDKVELELNVDDQKSTETLIFFRVDVRANEKRDGDFVRFISNIISGKTAFYVSTISWDRRSGRTVIQFECVGHIQEPRT